MIDYYKKDNVLSITYSKIGSNHVKDCTQNQDSIKFEQINDETWYLALADGVSTAKYAKDGAIAAILTVREISEALYNKKYSIDDVDSLKVAFVRLWKSRLKREWNKYASTINFIIFVNSEVLIGQIGDGLMVVNIDGKEEVFTDTEEFYTSQTYALGEVVRKKSFMLEVRHVDKSMFTYMTSDGIGKEIAEQSRNELGKYLFTMLNNSKELIEEELNHWIKDLEVKNGDDKSIGVIRLEEIK